MNKDKKKLSTCVVLAFIGLLLLVAFKTTDADSVKNTYWALVPPVVAISLALVTKEVYSSLFTGVVVGGLLYSGFSFTGTMEHVFVEGLIAQLTDPDKAGIIIFLVMLGILVALMNKGGGSEAFGVWASKHIKTRTGACLATILLGVLIFVDDYFNCLTVGSVMRPVTDKHRISRAKLAYLIDSTAAPICIIAPVSSWAAAVSGFVEGENGIALFIRTIPFNFYAVFTIVMMISLSIMNVDYGPMLMHENKAGKAELSETDNKGKSGERNSNGNGKVTDLILPVVILVVSCVLGMLYTGGFFDGENFVDAIAGCDASKGLIFGSFFGIMFTLIFYILRKVLTFDECMECIPGGFKAMVAPILILSLAWSLKGMIDSLGAKEYVAALVSGSAAGLLNYLPAMIFLTGCLLSFATGTSWGTFGILIPIVVNVFSGSDTTMMIIAMSACMAGAVCGDHCSPISDTTIMSSAGAQCNHLDHVTTQIPYAVTCAAVSFITYVIAGFSKSAVVSLPCGIAMIIAVVYLVKKIQKTE
ncbi:MAG: Na+/H+ antiporter NhaC family protein [Lachnospiraceae bacterium]|nr:Na+/H+ antiporter NhaC family protein [Lachnospiraceae bacterium]